MKFTQTAYTVYNTKSQEFWTNGWGVPDIYNKIGSAKSSVRQYLKYSWHAAREFTFEDFIYPECEVTYDVRDPLQRDD